MYIKEITLCGFKSYKEKTIVQDLVNGFNVIVGRNGSGKSNIFAGIEFALTVQHRATFQSLLSHSRNPTGTDPAYVELVFDNSDRKLPVSEDTVTFRRVLLAKKDRFYVNGKEISSVKKFLEAAGFTNPYFIVKQGKVQDLALANDAQRLKVINEAAGINVYEQKIAGCKKSIADADGKRKEIEEMMEELRTRKVALEEEVSEQRRFNKLDQSKRAIEFVLLERKLRETQRHTEELEARRKDSAKRQGPIRNELEKTKRNLQIVKRDLGDLELERKQLEEMLQQHESSRNDLARTITSRKQELDDLRSGPRNLMEKKNPQRLEHEISDAERKLKEVEKELEGMKGPLDELCQRKHQLDTRIQALMEQEAMKSSAKNARDKDYKRQAEVQKKALTQRVEENQRAIAALRKSMESAEENLKSEMDIMKGLKEELPSVLDKIKASRKVMEDCRSLESGLKSRLVAIWRDSAEIEKKYSQKRERVARLEEDCKACFGSSKMEGWKGVKRIISDFKEAGAHPEVVDGYYGLVCENLSCNPELDIAVDAAAGKKLTHHIVQSTRVAQQILREFNKRRYGGEVNFIPISGLNFSLSQTQISSAEGLQDAKPMLSLVNVENDRVTPVMEFVFGTTLLCKSLETATDLMRKLRWKCVTMDGEIVEKSGRMTGGYARQKLQKLELQRAMLLENNELAELAARKNFLDNDGNQLKEELRSIKRRFEQQSVQKTKFEVRKREILSSIETTEKKIASIKDLIATGKRNIEDCSANAVALEERRKVLESQNENPKAKTKTMQELNKVKEEFTELQKNYSAKDKERSSLDARLHQLKQSYYKGLEDSCGPDEESTKQEASWISDVIKSLTSQLADVESKIRLMKKDIEAVKLLLLEKGKEAGELESKQVKLEEQLAEVCAELESFFDNYMTWKTRLQDQTEALDKLGSVPSSIEKFENLSDTELSSKLKKINIKLKKMANVAVNQKAVQQFTELSENLSDFEERLKASMKEKKELLLFLKELEFRKGEAISENMLVLQEQFQSIFRSIVPNGNAELVLYGNDASMDLENESDSDPHRFVGERNTFEGVKVRVNFRGKELQTMKTLAPLSGGQKSIIALCLILAIQAVDPVPFYLFDEVDQALDAVYRDAVARQIGRMSENRQFICTTFRNEFISVADQIYGVSFQHQCSTIRPIAEDQALDFVESEGNSGESGDSVNIATGSPSQ